MRERIGFICPTHREAEFHDYTLAALSSFFRHTPCGEAIVVADAPSAGDLGFLDQLKTEFAGQPLKIAPLAQWGGLTRSWNYGLQWAQAQRHDYAICGNNDVLFTEFWYEGLIDALQAGYGLVGPVSNAPGVSSNGLADVWRYFPAYELDDSYESLQETALYLRRNYRRQAIPAPVNGFFQFAKTTTWWQGAFDESHVYRPRNDFNSRGQRNPTPLMTLNEDELQGRWRRKGWKTAIVPSSFIFHYRAVTRGDRYKKGRWMRRRSDTD